jgi:hypothetical protein
MARYVLDLPGFHPTPLNRVRGRHWSREHEAKRRDAIAYGWAAKVADCPRATGPRRVVLHLTGWARGGKLPDRDGFDKVLLDSLVRVGLITDDGPAGLVGRVEVTYERGPVGTRVVIEDVEES